MLTAVGIVVSFFTSFVATNFTKVTFTNVETTVKWQLIISTVIMSGAIFPLIYVLPAEFKFIEENNLIATGGIAKIVTCT